MKLIIEISDNHFKTLQKMNECGLGYYQRAILNGKPLEEELEKIIKFEENWLINIKIENGFISIADIETAMNGIRSVTSEKKRK